MGTFWSWSAHVMADVVHFEGLSCGASCFWGFARPFMLVDGALLGGG